jgi:hypothetical protein
MRRCISVRLTPPAMAELERLTAEQGGNRSATMSRIIERYALLERLAAGQLVMHTIDERPALAPVSRAEPR